MLSRREIIGALLAAPFAARAIVRDVVARDAVVPEGVPRPELLYPGLPSVLVNDVEFAVGREPLMLNNCQIFRRDYGVSGTFMVTGQKGGAGDREFLQEREKALRMLTEDVNQALVWGMRRTVISGGLISRYTAGVGALRSAGVVVAPDDLCLAVLRPLRHFDSTPAEMDGFQGTFILEAGLGLKSMFLGRTVIVG